MRSHPKFFAIVFTVGIAACGGNSGDDAAGRVSGDIVVLAAASLTEAFTGVGEAFEATYPDTSVTFSFAGSSALVAQILEGAPADVYASADRTTMARLTDAGADATEPVVFAVNRSEIVVAEGNPLGISGVADLTDPDLVVVTCAPEVPCGSFAAQIFERSGVRVIPDSYEENVKAVVTKVRLGEADAGIAYTTDVQAAGADVDGVDIPDEQNVVAEYPIVVTTEAPNPRLGQAFVDFVLGETGQAVLADHGFVTP